MPHPEHTPTEFEQRVESYEKKPEGPAHDVGRPKLSGKKRVKRTVAGVAATATAAWGTIGHGAENLGAEIGRATSNDPAIENAKFAGAPSVTEKQVQHGIEQNQAAHLAGEAAQAEPTPPPSNTVTVDNVSGFVELGPDHINPTDTGEVAAPKAEDTTGATSAPEDLPPEASGGTVKAP